MTDVVDIKTAKRPRKKAPPPAPTGDWRDALLYEPMPNGGQRLAKCVANAITILRHDDAWIDLLAFDELASSVVTLRPPPWHTDDAPTHSTIGEWTDVDTARAQAWLSRHYAIDVQRGAVYDAIRVIADRMVVHPVRDWLQGLTWDGVRRVPGWLSTYLGAERSSYVDNVGSWTLVAAVARIFSPGCKVDTMPVLEGPQGIGKSTAVRKLVGTDWFSDTPLDLASKDRFVALRSLWIHEFAELDALARAEISRVKSFMSSTCDDYRPPYGRTNVKVPRRCIFIGSVNDSEYLRDPTGNRRFWPVRCGRINLDAITRDRDQLWAEAVEMFRGGARWWPAPGDETDLCTLEQDDRAQRDAWEPLVADYLRKESLVADPFVTVGGVLEGAIKVEKGRWGQPEQNRVSRILIQLGWARRQRQANGIRSWGYAPLTSSGEPSGAPSGARSAR